MDAAATRIIQRMKEIGLDQKTFAEKIEIRPQAVTEWKQGISSSYSKRIVEIAAALDTTVEYLLTGTAPAPVPASRPELGEYERRLLAAAAGLSEEEMPLFLSRVERLAEKIKESRI